MIYPDNFPQKIEFELVKSLLYKYCKGDIALASVENLKPFPSFDKMNSELQITNEFKHLIVNRYGLPSESYFDLSEEMKSLSIEGTFLEPQKLVILLQNYKLYYDLIAFLPKNDFENYPNISKLLENRNVEPLIVSAIDKAIDKEGIVKDSATPELQAIRKSLSLADKAIENAVAKALQKSIKEKLIDSETEVVVRQGQLVIPITAVNKRKLSGLIIDESATGQTSYIQPAEAVEATNRKRELELAEKREIIKILISIADQVRPHLKHILSAFKFIGRVDFLRAKAMLAVDTQASCPQLFNKPEFSWYNAKHLLLKLSLQKQNKEIVPSNIEITENNSIVILSGPNAGGKSVCLKTIGLLQYMLQSGMLINVDEHSEAGFFDFLFLNIGDQQSIENDLSTYSSHLLNIKFLLQKANAKTLFLIDEFGSGTEPQSGGAIAEAVLEELCKKNAKGLVTTHYTNLKNMPAKFTGIVNAAMLYDTKQLKPLYNLEIGKPGSSFAFQIAKSIAFPKNIINNAAEKVGYSQLDFEQQIQDLDNEKIILENKRKQIEEADKTLFNLLEKYQKEYQDIQQKKNSIIKNANLEAKKIIEGANSKVENIIKVIKESQADKEKTKKARAELQKHKEMLTPTAKTKETEAKPTKVDVKVGGFAKLSNQDGIGKVLSIDGNKATLLVENITFHVNVSDLQGVTEKEFKNQQKNVSSKKSNIKDILDNNFKIFIDVRGKTVEEALSAVEKYLDDAALFHMKELRILHGKGNGILRSTIQSYLRNLPSVKTFTDAPIESGGTGVTLVTLK